MKKILILSDDDQLLINLFKQLNNKLKKNLQVTHILSLTNSTEELRNYFNNSKIIPRDEYTKGKISKNNNFMFDLPQMEQFLKIEQMFYRMLDFSDPDRNFYGHERRKIYYSLLVYMHLLLEEAKPDIIFFTGMPHSPHDYVLSMLAKYKKIPILIFRETNIPGLFCFSKTVSGQNKILSNYKNPNDDETSKIKKKLKEYLNNVSQNDRKKTLKMYSRGRDHSIVFGNLSKLNFFLGYFCFKIIRFAIFILNCLRPIIKSCLLILKGKIKNFKQFQNFFLMNDGFKSKDISYEKSKTNVFEFFYILYLNDKKKFKLYKEYKKHLDRFDKNKKYIFFPLHYQPEATNYPYADVFIDQINAIKMLSMHLPDNFEIFVKEHPDTFNVSRLAWIRGAFNRSLDYYSEIKKIPNVKIISLHNDLNEIIDNSVAVATLTGSTGLESVIRSKSSLIFGFPWYEGCNYIYPCRTHEECKNAMIQISNNEIVKKQEVDDFFEKVSKILILSQKTDIIGYQPYLNSEKEFQIIAKHFEYEFNSIING